MLYPNTKLTTMKKTALTGTFLMTPYGFWMLYTQYLRDEYKPMSRALVKRALLGQTVLPKVPVIPPPLVHSMVGKPGVAITGQRSKTMEPSFICISLVPKKVCVRQGCCKRPTPDTDEQFKKCSRCHANRMPNVWYCSQECQLQDYERHRPACKADPLCPIEQFALAAELGDALEHLTLVDTTSPEHVYSFAGH